jgi:hypothetical protein
VTGSCEHGEKSSNPDAGKRFSEFCVILLQGVIPNILKSHIFGIAFYFIHNTTLFVTDNDKELRDPQYRRLFCIAMSANYKDSAAD